VGHPLRLFDLTHGTKSTLLVYTDGTSSEDDIRDLDALAAEVGRRSSGEVDAYLITSADARVPEDLGIPLLRDHAGNFRDAYNARGITAYLIRPDGHVGYRSTTVTLPGLSTHLQHIFAAAQPSAQPSAGASGDHQPLLSTGVLSPREK
jgi:hypothetical protein